MPPTVDPCHDPRALRYALQILLIAAFLTGGSSQISGWDDAFVQLMAAPMLAWGLWRLPTLPRSGVRNLSLLAAGLIVLVPLVQMLPLTESLWLVPEARRHLAADMAAVGAAPAMTWSLDPRTTERSFLFLVPPMALFVCSLVVGRETHRRLLRSIMLLALFSLVLAFLQLGVPAESVLNPFPQWAHQFNGVFANQNHQAISLVVAIAIALTGMLAAIPRAQEGLRDAWSPWVLGFAALFALCALPLTQSRGAVLIGTFAVAAVPLTMGLFDRRRLREGWGARMGLAASIGLMALGVWATIGWMQVDMVDELRKPMREATVALGSAHGPWGAGIGPFAEIFEQDGPSALMLERYVNHTHNEYLQWWLEAGWLGVVVSVLTIATYLVIAAKALRSESSSRTLGVAATIAATAMLAHSWVDYPLRTGSLAAVAGVLCAIVVVAAARGKLSKGSDLERREKAV